MNPLLLTIPVFIAAVLTIACGVLFSIIHRKDEEIDNLIKNLLTLKERHEEIVDKLEHDLKQSDEAYDLIVNYNSNLTKDLDRFNLKCDEWQNKYLDKREELNREKVDRDVEVKHLTVKLNAVQIQLNQANARTFTGRKRNNKGQFVTVAKDVEP